MEEAEVISHQFYTPQVKYAGPIVYSGEKPPIIHFPPPPEPSYSNGGYGGGGGNKPPPAVKYVPLPHHELPVLIYQSDNSPPIHVVHTPRPAQVSYQEKPTYNQPPPAPQKKPAYKPPPPPPAPQKKPAYKPPPPTKPAYKPPPPPKPAYKPPPQKQVKPAYKPAYKPQPPPTKPSYNP